MQQKTAMDFGFYKRARAIKHKAAAMPFYPRKPAQVAVVAPASAPAQQPTGSKVKQPAAATNMWSMPAPPPSTVVATEAGGGNGGVAPPSGGGDADVDRLAALYISRVQERLRRERMADDWRKYY